MAMTFHQLKIFWAVAQAKSYTKASKILGLAQPSLSQQISKLEDELGSKLFDRGFSKINLTAWLKEECFLLQRTTSLLSIFP